LTDLIELDKWTPLMGNITVWCLECKTLKTGKLVVSSEMVFCFGELFKVPVDLNNAKVDVGVEGTFPWPCFSGEQDGKALSASEFFKYLKCSNKL